MIIKNKKELAQSKTDKLALNLLEKAIKSTLPDSVISNSVSFNKKSKTLKIKNKSYKIKGRIFIIGAGKASGFMAKELEKILPSRLITQGIINTNNIVKTSKIKIINASHPAPSPSSIKGAKQILNLKSRYNINKDDLIICLISGGGSSLLTYPLDNLTLKDLQKTTKELIKCGASIKEINVIRKHLSKVKGGNLAKHFDPAKIISLILSDVPDNDLSTIASGPTAPDKSTFSKALSIIKKYNLKNKIPKSVFNHLTKGKNKLVPETPKKLSNSKNIILASNKTALDQIKKSLSKTKSIIKPLSGTPSFQASKIIKDIKFSKSKIIIYGGETYPKIKSRPEKGGRNQQLVLSVLSKLKPVKRNFTFASINTDGIDYIQGIGGAIINQSKINKLQRNKIKKDLQKFNSYSSLKKINSLIKSDQTGTNVGDIAILIKE